MIQRRVGKLLAERLAAYPAVTLVGPRQCGKTTLARSLPGEYFDLEQEPDRLRLDLEWDRLTSGRRLVVLDEAQAWPGVFPRLRGAIDADRRRPGRFLLLGSVSPALMTEVSESLAGRLSVLELTPFLYDELASEAARRRLWLVGGFPDGGILQPSCYPQWQRDYLALLTQRDLPNWGLPAAPRVTDRLLRMTAALHGQPWNASQVGQSLGLSYKTVNSYVDYLEAAFLVRRLPPFQANVRKRLVKTPRLYWRDSGLLHAVMNAPDDEALLAQPWVGASWEGFILEQVLGALSTLGVSFEPYYFRTSDQYELDLVLDTGRELWAIEVKLTASPGPDDMARLDRAADMVGATRRFLVTRTRRPSGDERRASCDLPGLIERLRQIGG
jgi:hypothetical protein